MPTLLRLLVLVCMPCMLGACSILPPASTHLASKTLDDLPRVHNTPLAPCRVQREIAAQTTYLASVARQLPADTVYAAPCDMLPNSKAATPPVS